MDCSASVSRARSPALRPSSSRAAAALPGTKLALDIATGINADTGAVMGVAFRATHTITFIAGKPGLYMLDGPDHCGEVHLAISA
jgi:NAD(P)H-hydrate repair Nnr-like enzyme with NAD(P)H-hydrate epimerase domain